MKRQTIILLGLIVICGAFLRAWDLGSDSLWIDEGFTINAAQATLNQGYPLLDSGAFYPNGLLTSYLTAISLKIGHFDPFYPWQTRLPSMLFGTGLIAAVFFLSKKILRSDNLALLSSALISFSYWEIAWSRQARGYMAVSLFAVLALIYILKLIENKKVKYAWAALGFGAISALSHSPGLAFIPAILGITASAAPIATAKLSGIRRIVVFLIACVCVIAGILAFVALDPSKFQYLYIDFFTSSLPIISVIVLVGLAISIAHVKKFPKDLSLILSLYLFISLFFVIAYARTNQFRYMLPFFPLMIVLMVYASQQSVEILFPKIKHTQKIWLACFIAILASASGLTFLPLSHYELESGSPQPDFAGAFGKAKESWYPGYKIISGYADLNQIYLEEKGYWLKMGLAKKDGNGDMQVFNSVDYYAGAPVIPNLQGLIASTARHGYLIIDGMTRSRLPDIYRYAEDSQRFRLVYSAGDGRDEQISVYRF